jgi:drug/metabolite transporter (DMT)-like permease
MRPNNNFTSNGLRDYYTLHFLIFIWGFTAILGALISLEAIPLVWYRLTLTIPFLLIWFWFQKISIRIDAKAFFRFFFLGAVISLHWFSFFHAIKVSNVSVTLITLSTGAFFTSLLEPIFFKRRVSLYEVILGLSIVAILYFMFRGDTFSIKGMLWGLSAALTSALFSVINGLYVKTYKPEVITLYEFGIGAVIISVVLLFTGGFSMQFFNLSASDWMYLLLLASICTAYAGLTSIKLMKNLSPYTIMLSINLEPVYGIILALLIFGDKEKMSSSFYIGGALILGVVVLNSVLKMRAKG